MFWVRIVLSVKPGNEPGPSASASILLAAMATETRMSVSMVPMMGRMRPVMVTMVMVMSRAQKLQKPLSKAYTKYTLIHTWTRIPEVRRTLSIP